jgi:HAD superfamily hydrolase (TIGR01549 family)
MHRSLMAASHAGRARIRGIIFDMDGTLTNVGAIDFARIRERCGIPPKHDIIAFCEEQAEPKRTHLLRIVEEEEDIGLNRMSLRPECRELILQLHGMNLHRALLTRNNEAAMGKTVALLENPEAFSIMLSRAFTPVKPHPAAIHHICGHWKCSPAEVIMCGDSIDDMTCGKAAGARTVLIGDTTCKHYQEALPLADHSISRLGELVHILEGFKEETPGL